MMKNTFGQSVSITLFGESHGEAIGCVLDGISPGVKVDNDFINLKLSQRKAYGKISTPRREKDECRIVSGVYNGFTTGTPITVIIENNNTKSGDYAKLREVPRPGHADYTAECKYHGFQDYRGGGHFSGRITAPIVAAGAICMMALRQKGIEIGTHIVKCGNVSDTSFKSMEYKELSSSISALNDKLFPTIDNVEDKMVKLIEETASRNDSIGGVLETAVVGMPEGVGEPWFDSIESVLSHGLFSIPAVKGVEFGMGFGFADVTGSKANDAFAYDGDRIVTSTNNNGGINGGITNGMPIIFSSVIKPTPSIGLEQNTVNLASKSNEKLNIGGRHDPAIIHRARVVVDSIIAICLTDLLALRFGTDYFTEDK